MKYEEALEIITNAIQRDGMTIEQDKALSIAQKAIENLIPKKAVTKGFVIYHCPNCNGVLNDLVKYPYCDRCGQAIDWSDVE